MGLDLQVNVWHVLSFLISGGVAVYAHIMTRQRVTEDELDQHKEDMTEMLNGFGQRLVRVEEAARHAPTHEDLGGIHEKLNEGNGELKKLVGEFEGMRAQLHMITQHLMKER